MKTATPTLKRLRNRSPKKMSSFAAQLKCSRTRPRRPAKNSGKFYAKWDQLWKLIPFAVYCSVAGAWPPGNASFLEHLYQPQPSLPDWLPEPDTLVIAFLFAFIRANSANPVFALSQNGPGAFYNLLEI